MTSERFSVVRVDEIIVLERQRKDVGDLSDLTDDIAELGQRHPVVLQRDKVLVCGERRLRAHQKLGREYIDVLWTDETDPFRLLEMQFSENEIRKNFTWQEQYDAIVDYHNKRCSADRNWTQVLTAKRLRKSTALVNKYISISKLKAEVITELKEQADLSTAWSKAKRINHRLEDTFDEGVGEICSDLIPGGYKRTERIESPIINKDFIEWAPIYTSTKFNFIHCDFPYGIDTDKRQQGNAIAVHGGYDDSEENYWRLLGVLCDNLDRICEASAHIMFWFSMKHHDETRKFFADQTDFTFDEYPLVWMKSDGAGIPPRPDYGPRRTYETCLFGWRGGRKISAEGVVANSYYGPTDRQSDHPSPKPEPMLKHFFSMIIDSKSKVLDPTCGSGSALRAAKSLGAEYVLGIEKDKNFAETATREFEKWVRANGNGADPMADRPAV
jgi:ParB/RepB/Spo0J family partition protein